MFKYLRSLNTEFHPTVVEVIAGDTNPNTPDVITPGSFITILDGVASPVGDIFKTPYLALSSKNENEEKKVRCMRVSSGMVFEADISSDCNTSRLFLGARMEPGPNFESFINDVTFCTGSGMFEVLDTSNVSNGKVTVVYL